jgi:hypothetical protein
MQPPPDAYTISGPIRQFVRAGGTSPQQRLLTGVPRIDPIMRKARRFVDSTWASRSLSHPRRRYSQCAG